MLLFDGTTAQRVFLKIGPGIGTTASLISPDNVTMASVNFGGAVNAFIDTLTLNRAGTYTVVADPNGTSTGNVTLTVYDVAADATGTLTFGTQHPLSLEIGQNARLTFAGTATHRLSMNVGGSVSSTTVAVVRPDGTTQTSLTKGPLSAFLEPITLATTGTYAVTVDPSGYNDGTANLTIYDVPDDLTGSMTPTATGDSEQVSIGTAGQNAVLTFSGTTGQRVSLKIAPGGVGSTTSIRRPDGTTLDSVTTSGVGNPFIDTMTLDATGTHSILFDPTKADTGTSTLTFYEVPADLTGTLTINGGAIPVTMSTPGQNASYTFSGTSGQQVTVRIAGNTYGSTKVRLLRPDGTELTSSTSGLNTFNLATQTLPTTGTYTVVVDPQSSGTGTLNLSVTNP